MALDTYAGLQAAVLDWIARPGDPLVQPALPEMITLFEAEMRLRLRHIGNETMAQLYTTTGAGDLPLPDDFVELRAASIDGLGKPLEVLSASQAATMTSGGVPAWFTIYGGGDFGCSDGGAMMRLVPPPGGNYTINITYLRGLPPLSDAAPSNWLLKKAPQLYLWGTLVECSAYIGFDERAKLWLERRDATWETLERDDRKARWGGPLTMHADMVTP